MHHVFIEPIPKGLWGPIDGYTLEYSDGDKVTTHVFRSEKLAIDEVKLRGFRPMVAKVRITDKGNHNHWIAI
ncbi:hypothetical protein AWB78_05649 [Caballeronia calidae]|uniref:Uncharacterized protein n=1 Tax=Caballeronia calidae TaxID=1777139 RepID=A0A158DUM2_9BURK|nr:hypothetical protein AWB78_05649 [Caballeronia calidae]